MNRRNAISALLAFGTAPICLYAQQPRLARVGILATWPPSAPAAQRTWSAFYAELRARGWDAGRNFVIEGRYTEGRVEKLPAFVGELVAAAVDVIVAGDSLAVDSARKATRTIPIVMTNVSHAVEAGFVASFSHPGGNVTGVTNQLSDLMAKHVEFLRLVRPDMKKVGVFWSPDNAGSALAFKDMQAVVRSLGIDVVSLPIGVPADLARGLAVAHREGVLALHVHPTATIAAGFRQIADWAAQNRVISISGRNDFTRGGLLMSYGADTADVYRTSATFVDRILRGAKPADLPVEQPTKFELILNLKTAKVLGVTIPQSILVRADEVIQ